MKIFSGADGGIRTRTGQGLSLLPLPIALHPHRPVYSLLASPVAICPHTKPVGSLSLQRWLIGRAPNYPPEWTRWIVSSSQVYLPRIADLAFRIVPAMLG